MGGESADSPFLQPAAKKQKDREVSGEKEGGDGSV